MGATSIQAVIFDLDGTLVDSLEDIAAALGGALADAGLARPPVELVRTKISRQPKSMTDAFFSGFGPRTWVTDRSSRSAVGATARVRVTQAGPRCGRRDDR